MPLQQGEDGDRELYDSLFRCLQKPVRRRILFSLVDNGPRKPLLVPEDAHVGEMDLEKLHLELHHCHLPTLEVAGFIQWDPESRRVHRGSRFAEIRELLEAISDHDPILRGE